MAPGEYSGDMPIFSIRRRLSVDRKTTDEHAAGRPLDTPYQALDAVAGKDGYDELPTSGRGCVAACKVGGVKLLSHVSPKRI